MARVSESVQAARGAALRLFAEAGGGDRVVMARALSSLFIAGAFFGFVSLLLPHPSDTNIAGIAAICGLALLVGVGLALERGRLPHWAFPAACYAGTALISLALYFSDRADSPYSFYFVLVAMFAAYFLSVRQLVLQTAFIALAYPVVVNVLDASDEQPEQRWLLTIWTVMIVAVFIGILRRRMNALIGRL